MSRAKIPPCDSTPACHLITTLRKQLSIVNNLGSALLRTTSDMMDGFMRKKNVDFAIFNIDLNK
jgi:hypothetical protein